MKSNGSKKAFPHAKIGTILVQAREEKRIAQRDLAKRIGVSASTVCDYEHGRKAPRTPTLAKIARVLDLDIRDLVAASR